MRKQLCVAGVVLGLLGCSSSSSSGTDAAGGTGGQLDAAAGSTGNADATAGAGGSGDGAAGTVGSTDAAAGSGGAGGATGGAAGNVSDGGPADTVVNGGGDGPAGDASGPMKTGSLPGPMDMAVTTLSNKVQRTYDPKFMTTDSAGDVFLDGGLVQNIVQKFDPAFTPVWLAAYPPTYAGLFGVADIAATPAGVVYFTGTTNAQSALPGETSAGGEDAAIGQVSATGQLAWVHSLGSPVADAGVWVRVAPDGGAVVFGRSAGQLPGQPVAAKGAAFAAGYSSSGTRLWATQAPGIGAFLDAAVDPMGKSYAVFFGKVTGWAADGTLSWTKDYSIDLLSPQNQDFHVAADPKGQGFYTFGGYYPRCVLAHWSTDGVPVWYRDSMQQQKVLDPVEGVMWTGGFNRCRGILSTTDAVYVFGMYTTQIKNGSTIRKDQGNSVFIGRYDLDGNQVWFKQYVGPDTGGNFNYPGNPLLAVGANGDLVFTTTAKYITHLHAMTGEPF